MTQFPLLSFLLLPHSSSPLSVPLCDVEAHLQHCNPKFLLDRSAGTGEMHPSILPNGSVWASVLKRAGPYGGPQRAARGHQKGFQSRVSHLFQLQQRTTAFPRPPFPARSTKRFGLCCRPTGH